MPLRHCVAGSVSKPFPRRQNLVWHKRPSPYQNLYANNSILHLQLLLSQIELRLEEWFSSRNPRHPSDGTSDPPRLLHIQQKTVRNSSRVSSVPTAKPLSWKTWRPFKEPEIFGLWLTEGPNIHSEADFGISRVCHGWVSPMNTIRGASPGSRYRKSGEISLSAPLWGSPTPVCWSLTHLPQILLVRSN